MRKFLKINFSSHTLIVAVDINFFKLSVCHEKYILFNNWFLMIFFIYEIGNSNTIKFIFRNV
jgi:hypothetical protein